MVIGIFVVASGLAIAAATWTTQHIDRALTRVPDVFPTGERPAPVGEGLTFLLVGRDPEAVTSRDSLADSVMLVRVTGSRTEAQAVYLPVYAAAEPGGPTLGRVFGDGGPPRLIGAVEQLTGVRVDHYAEVDFEGFETVTDALGGVDVDVPERYVNDGQVFDAGRQHLDGAAALAYVRDAGQGSEDTSEERQQLVLRGLFERMSDQGMFTDIGRLTSTLESLARAVSIDDTLSDVDLVQLVWSLRSLSEPEFLTAPVTGDPVGPGGTVTFDETRAGPLWQYLREDRLGDHLDEFA
ncbi:LCP family protein [Geodermatophilus sp. SYSU D00710]